MYSIFFFVLSRNNKRLAIQKPFLTAEVLKLVTQKTKTCILTSRLQGLVILILSNMANFEAGNSDNRAGLGYSSTTNNVTGL